MASFNLSKTEFIAYLECPLKFYIIKSLNQGLAQGPRGERDYSPFPDETKEGMKWHAWFAKFHEEYDERIKKGEPISYGENQNEKVIANYFYNYELERYQAQTEFWKPLAKETYLENDDYRGIIDRIDQLNEKGDCRIVEYKKEKGWYDVQELLFYAYLMVLAGDQIEGISKLGRIKEIGIYYYSTGKFVHKEISQKEIMAFGVYLEALKEEIKQQNWRKKENCSTQKTSCKYSAICERIPEGLLPINESQKIGKRFL